MELCHDDLPVESCALHQPPLDEVARVLQTGLEANFAEVEVKVVDCPDLAGEEWGLAASGLGGSTRLLDIGGVPYLIPLPDRSKLYDMAKYPQLCGLPDGGFIVGAGAGPYPYINRNSEMMPNLLVNKAGEVVVQNTHITRTYDHDGSYATEVLPPTETRNALLGNLFVSEGKSGQVVRVHCKGRTGDRNFVTCMRETLDKHYGSGGVVGMGGTFKLLAGKAKIHVMPNFSTCPLKTDEDVENWLNFYEMNSPFTFLSAFYSRDPGQDVRVEHTHGWGEDGAGGHYHYDTTPAEAEYLGYFNIAQQAVRVDRPKQTHMIGRD